MQAPRTRLLCGKYKETLKHINVKYAILQKNRMKRHNRTCNLLRFECENQGWTVLQEKRLSLTIGEVGIPDLIMIEGTSAMVLGVAIPFEVSTLSDSEKGKTTKYCAHL